MSYYLLIASLPPLPSHFDVERPPISQQRLRERLKPLSDSDAAVIHELADFFSWDRQVIDQTEQDIERRYESLMHESQPLIREIIDHRINMRTIVAALRRRRKGIGPPQAVGPLVDVIRQRWGEPTFGLGRRFPWIESFTDHLEAGRYDRAERELFEFTWRTWSRLAASFSFCFETIPLYLARWEIVDRWTSRDSELGRERFDQLTAEVLGAHANLNF